MQVDFLVRHGKIEAACALILDKKLQPGVFVSHVFEHCMNYNYIEYLKQIMLKLGNEKMHCFSNCKKDPTLKIWEKYLLATCRFLDQRKATNMLYKFQVFMKDEARAALTCIRLFLLTPIFESKIAYLTQAEVC